MMRIFLVVSVLAMLAASTDAEPRAPAVLFTQHAPVIDVPPEGLIVEVHVAEEVDTVLRFRGKMRVLAGLLQLSGIESHPKERDGRIDLTVTDIDKVHGGFSVSFVDTRLVVIRVSAATAKNPAHPLINFRAGNSKEHLEQEAKQREQQRELARREADRLRADAATARKEAERAREAAARARRTNREARVQLAALAPQLVAVRRQRDNADKRARVAERELIRAEERAVELERRALTAEETARRLEEKRKRETFERLQAESQPSREIQDLTPTSVKTAGRQASIGYIRSRWDSSGQYLLTRFELCNRDLRRLTLSKVRVADVRNREYKTFITLFGNRGGRTLDVDECAEGAVATLTEDAAQLRTVEFNFGGEPFVVTVKGWKLLRVLQYSVARDEFMRAMREQEQLIIGPRVFGGAYWVPNGRDSRKVDAASFWGVGVQLTKGFSKHFAFEAEAAGGGTSDSSFEDGLLKRSARFGRVKAGGALRFGRTLIPTVRAGLALQGTSYHSLTSGVEKPDDGLDISLLWSVGFAMDYRLSEQFVTGVAVSAAAPTAGEETIRTFAIGLYLGYGWNPFWESDF